jgi:hypothetical protein
MRPVQEQGQLLQRQTLQDRAMAHLVAAAATQEQAALLLGPPTEGAPLAPHAAHGLVNQSAGFDLDVDIAGVAPDCGLLALAAAARSLARSRSFHFSSMRV